MGERLAGGDAGLTLLCNAIATGCALVALVATLQPLSGAHLNPVVTLLDAVGGTRSWREVVPYVAAQITGAICGVVLANVMFGEPAFTFSQRVRSGPNLWLAEAIATFGLIVLVFFSARARSNWIPLIVGTYITAAYWFTSSTSFANPAVTIARSLSNSFAGIRPADVVPFLIAQLIGAALAGTYIRWTFARNAESESQVRSLRLRA